MEKLSKHIPHVGLRKLKSVFAVFLGFWVWQLIRLAVPNLEVHPIYIHLWNYRNERFIRENSEFWKIANQSNFCCIGLGLATLVFEHIPQFSYVKRVIAND